MRFSSALLLISLFAAVTMIGGYAAMQHCVAGQPSAAFSH